MQWRPDRITMLVILAYFITVASSFLLMWANQQPADPFDQPATPVFGQKDESPPASDKLTIPVLGQLQISTDSYQNIITRGIPGLKVEEQPTETSSWYQILDETLYILTDIRVSQPLSYLRTSYPMLSLAMPPGPGTKPHYVMHLPSDEFSEDEPPGEQHSTEDAKLSEENDKDLWLGEDEPAVIIYHSHTQESFWDAVRDATGGQSPQDPFIRDGDFNMLRVGEELADELNSRYGVATIHVREYFDTLPDGTGMNRVGAYARSGDKITTLQKEYPSARILLDVHRDATPRDVTVFRDEVTGKKGARVMMVVGSDTYLDHPEWEKNLQFAETIADIMEEKYPGLFLRILQRDYRFNQHLSPGALLLEMGGAENTLDEALKSARMMARVIAIALKRNLVPTP